MSTRTRHLCVYCGAARAASEEHCASCGRGWIDERIVATSGGADDPTTSSNEGPVDVPFPTIDHETPQPPVAPEPARRRGVAVGFVVAAAVVLVLVVALGTRGSSDEPTATQETTSTTVAPTTTAATTTAAPATTRAATTTTTAAPTTTTTTTAPTIKTIGNPIPLENLTLGAFAIGQFEFDASAEEAIGRLAATFGQPDAVLTADETWGLCPTDTGSVTVWGPLSVITRADDAGEILAAYRLDMGNDDHPATGLTTLSGLRLGATTAELEAIYVAPVVDYVEVDGVPAFRLLRSSDRRLLLWGPVADDTVTGIYSPRPCDQGP